MEGASPVNRVGSVCRDLGVPNKFSYFRVCDHMGSEPARFAGISLFFAEISAKRADDFLM